MKACCTCLTALFLAVAAWGCSLGYYAVNVTGYLDPDRPITLVPDNSIFVVESRDAENPLLEREVGNKISRLLKESGYRSAPTEEADFHLVFRYGMDRGPIVTESFPKLSTVSAYDPYFDVWVSNAITSYDTYSVQHYTRFFAIRVIDADTLRSDERTEVVWACDVMSEGENNDLRDVVNYLLVAAFEHFGQDTEKAVRITIDPEDARVQKLRSKD